MKSLIKSYLSSIIIGIISFLTAIILARYLSVDERGAFGELITVLSLSTIISSLSLDQASIIQSKKIIRRNFFKYLIKIYFFVLALFLIIFVFLHQILDTGLLTKQIFVLSLIYSFVNFFSVILNSLILMINLNYWNMIRISTHLFNLLFLLITFLFFTINSEMAYFIFVLSSVLVLFLIIILIVFILLQNSKIIFKLKDKKYENYNFLKDGFKIHINNVTRILIDRLDQLFLIAFFDKVILAYYLIGISIPKSLIFIFQSIDNFLINQFKDLSGIKIKNILLFCIIIVIFSFSIFVLLFGKFNTHIIKLIYSEKYIISSQVFLTFILGAPFYLLRQMCLAIMKSKKMFKLIFYSELFYISLIFLTLIISKINNNWIYIAYGFNLSLFFTSMINFLMLFIIYKIKTLNYKKIKF